MEALLAEALKASIIAYFQYQREKGRTDAEAKQRFDAISDEAVQYHPDNMIDPE